MHCFASGNARARAAFATAAAARCHIPLAAATAACSSYRHRHHWATVTSPSSGQATVTPSASIPSLIPSLPTAASVTFIAWSVVITVVIAVRSRRSLPSLQVSFARHRRHCSSLPYQPSLPPVAASRRCRRCCRRRCWVTAFAAVMLLSLPSLPWLLLHEGQLHWSVIIIATPAAASVIVGQPSRPSSSRPSG